MQLINTRDYGRETLSLHTFYCEMQIVLWYLQLPNRVIYRPSWSWKIDLLISSSRTSGCLMSCWGWRYWVEDSTTRFALETKRPMNEVMPCSICSQQRISVTSSWKPYSERTNNMSWTLSRRTEVRNTITYQFNVALANKETVIQWWSHRYLH